MTLLYTQKDRDRFRLRREIDQHVEWLHESHGDRRAVAFHQAKIAELRAEMDKLED